MCIHLHKFTARTAHRTGEIYGPCSDNVNFVMGLDCNYFVSACREPRRLFLGHLFTEKNIYVISLYVRHFQHSFLFLARTCTERL